MVVEAVTDEATGGTTTVADGAVPGADGFPDANETEAEAEAGAGAVVSEEATVGVLAAGATEQSVAVTVM